MGLLANTDSSILDIRLEHGFRIEDLPEQNGLSLINGLESLPPHLGLLSELHWRFRCFNTSERKFYIVSNAFESDIEIDGEGRRLTSLPSEVPRFDNKSVHGYLRPTIQLMRLFKKGNICMPSTYYFFIHEGVPRLIMSGKTSAYVSPELYTLQGEETEKLQRFIKEADFPLKKAYLQLAFQNFELSYQIQIRDLSFLTLMIALEALFNRGQLELGYTISRNVAVLLGSSKSRIGRNFL